MFSEGYILHLACIRDWFVRVKRRFHVREGAEEVQIRWLGGEALLMCNSVIFYTWTRHVLYTWLSIPWTEETGLKKSGKFSSRNLRLRNFPTSCHGRPRIYQICFLGSPQNFHEVFTWVNGVPVNQKSGRETRPNLEIQIFHVWSPPWVACPWLVLYWRHESRLESCVACVRRRDRVMCLLQYVTDGGDRT